MSKTTKTSQFVTEAYIEMKQGAEILDLVKHIPMEEKIRAIKMASGMLGQTFDLTYLENLRENCEKLNTSTKFRLPLNGNLMDGVADDKSFAFVVKNFLQAQRLPFPLVALEFETNINHNVNTPCKAVVVLAEEIERPEQFPLIKLKIFKKIQLEKGRSYSWSNLKYEYLIDFEKISSENDQLFDFVTMTQWQLTAKPTESKLDMIQLEIKAFLEFMLALSCKNLEVRKSHPPSLKENSYREKKGLPLLPQYNEIVLNLSQSNRTGKGTTKAMIQSGSSKAPHLRRGHIRRYEDKVVWVTSAVVNADKAENVVQVKNYKVK